MVDTFNRFLRRVPAWVVYVIGLVFIGFIFGAVILGTAGADPVRALERGLGERGLQVLIAALCITPLRWVKINAIKFRRAIGLVGFTLILLHFATWIVLDMGLRWSEITAALIRRPYIIFGFASFVMMVPLAITSNSASIRRLGAAGWKRLHWLAYPATLAGAIHVVMIGKVYKTDALMYLAAVVALLAARAVMRWVKARKYSGVVA